MRDSGWGIRGLGVLATVGMFVVDMVGFLDTETKSALGCGRDWPLCHGAVIPRFVNVHVTIEFLHRAIVGGFAVITVIFVLWAWRRYPHSRAVKGFSALAVGFIVIQSILGAVAVIWVNPPPVLALHLGFGLLALVGTGLLTVVVFRLAASEAAVPRIRLPAGVRRLVWLIWGYAFAAIYWGSYVAFRQAGAACRGWPLCNGRWFGQSNPLVLLDEIHRLVAVGLAALVVWLLVALYRYRRTSREIWVATVILAVLVATQIASGAYLVFRHLATGPYLLHVGNVSVLFLVLSYLAYRSLESAPEPVTGSASGRPPIT